MQLPDAVPEEIKQERRARFMAAQEKISASRLRAKVGRTLTVLVDEIGTQGAIARSAADAPEIDGLVHIQRTRNLKLGEFAQVRVTRSDSHDLWAVPVCRSIVICALTLAALLASPL